MKLLSLFMLISATLSTSHADVASDYFWRDFDTVKTVSKIFTTQQTADFAMFDEMYSKTQAQLRRELVSEAIQLMRAGARGSEALKMIEKLDDRAWMSRQVSKQGIGKALAKYFRSEMESIYENYESEGGQRKIYFVKEIAEYSVHISWGVRPNAVIYATVEITNNLTGASKAVSHLGHHSKIRTMAYFLASKFFHSLHKTRFPIEKKSIGSGRVVFHPPRPLTFDAYASYKAKAERAQAACKAAGRSKRKAYRLINFTEMEELTSLGHYHGGIGKLSRKSGWAVQKSKYDKSPMIINNQYYNGAPDNGRNIYLGIKYICAEDVKYRMNY